MKCKKCGTIVSLNNMFCPGCGSIISKETISTENNYTQNDQASIYNNTPSGYVPKENLKTTYKPNIKKKSANKKTIYIYSGLAIILIVGVVLFYIFTTSKEVKVPKGYVRIGAKEVGYINVPDYLDVNEYGNIAHNENYYIEMDANSTENITLKDALEKVRSEAESICEVDREKEFIMNDYYVYNIVCETSNNKSSLYFIEYKERIYLITITIRNNKNDISHIIDTFNVIK